MTDRTGPHEGRDGATTTGTSFTQVKYLTPAPELDKMPETVGNRPPSLNERNPRSHTGSRVSTFTGRD